MERIYFDKQIFSYLFKGKDPIYTKFLSDLYAYKDSFIFCFSHAHLLDLKNDKTDIKYSELEFMETLVKDNYLAYDPIQKRTACFLEKPSEAFKDTDVEETPFSFSNFFSDIDLSFATQEQKEQILVARNVLENQKIDFNFPQMADIPEELQKPFGSIFPIGVDSLSIMEWSEHLMGMVKSMEEDKTVYKGVRNVVDKYVNNGKFTIDIDTIDFNKDLKNSVLQKTFIEYVNGNLNPNGDKEVTNYDFFINAYFTLDLLGISKEPAKSVKFKNVMNDGFHSYYGAFCDYVVSDDQGFLKKSKVMYKLLGIETKIFHIDDFIEYFYTLKENKEKDINTFLTVLINDINDGLVINSWDSINYDRHTKTIRPLHNYLGYFNVIDNINEENQNFIYISRKVQNYSNFLFYREFEGVVNRAIRLFGTDTNLKSFFEWDKEIEEIETHIWEGRFWEFDTFKILLEINKGNGKFSLLVS